MPHICSVISTKANYKCPTFWVLFLPKQTFFSPNMYYIFKWMYLVTQEKTHELEMKYETWWVKKMKNQGKYQVSRLIL